MVTMSPAPRLAALPVLAHVVSTPGAAGGNTQLNAVSPPEAVRNVKVKLWAISPVVMRTAAYIALAVHAAGMMSWESDSVELLAPLTRLAYEVADDGNR